MKYIIVIGDGMADWPVKELGGKTLLEACNTPNLDYLAKEGCGGLVKTVPDSCEPGSDVANLSILGYDPTQYYTGRAPLEAVSMGVKLGRNDVAFRCNLVAVEGNILADYSAGHIATEEAHKIIAYLREQMNDIKADLLPGVSYRHLMVFRNAPESWRKGKLKTTPPHDITGREFYPFLPVGEDSELPKEIMRRSMDLLKSYSAENSKFQTNMIWLWGHGGAVQLPSIPLTWNINGATISAVDLVRGIGMSAGLETEIVEGATGFVDTNYQGKVSRAIEVLKEKDFVYLHIEAPDEAGHTGNWQIKKQAIEDFDAKVIGPLLKELYQFSKFRLLILPDHATPVELKTHSREPVPFVIYPAIDEKTDLMKVYNEHEAEKGAYRIDKGHELFRLFMQ